MLEDIIIGVSISALSAIAGAIIQELYITSKAILAGKFTSKPESNSTSHLHNLKYEYRIIDSGNNEEFFVWVRSDIKISKVKNNLIFGIHNRYHNEDQNIPYVIKGENRDGSIIFTETNQDNPHRFFTAIYSSEISSDIIPGLFIEYTSQGALSSITILSKEILEYPKLNKVVESKKFDEMINIKGREIRTLRL
jgi:hypothetical protein